MARGLTVGIVSGPAGLMLSHLLSIVGDAVVHRVITDVAVLDVDAGAFRVDAPRAPGACGGLGSSVRGVPPHGASCSNFLR